MRTLFCLAGWLFAAALAGAAPRPLVFLKTGERFATQETAGPTVAGLTAWLGPRLGGTTNDFAPQVFNDPKAAVEFCARAPASVAIVTPGFYLAYAKPLDLEPLLEVQRRGVDTERLVLIGRRDGPADLAGWAGKSIATSLAAEDGYVLRVALEGKLGNELRLQPVADVEGALLNLAEGAKDAAALVLLEEATWKALAEDPDLGPKLRVVFRSADLTGPLVVLVHAAAKPVDAAKLTAVLQQMPAEEEGRRILESILVKGFVPVNQDRLRHARELFQGK